MDDLYISARLLHTSVWLLFKTKVSFSDCRWSEALHNFFSKNKIFVASLSSAFIGVALTFIRFYSSQLWNYIWKCGVNWSLFSRPWLVILLDFAWSTLSGMPKASVKPLTCDQPRSSDVTWFLNRPAGLVIVFNLIPVVFIHSLTPPTAVGAAFYDILCDSVISRKLP